MGLKILSYFRHLVLLAVLLTWPAHSYPQVPVQRPSRQAALDAFSRGDYEKAYIEFDILLSNYSRDPLYKYYKGVCLVRLSRDSQHAQEYLLDALNGALDIKSIPDDAWFYLGRAQQMSGRYSEALKSFSTYENKAGKRKAVEMNVPLFVQEAKENRGKINDPLVSEGNPVATTTPVSNNDNKVKDIPPLADLPSEKQLPRKEEIPEDYDKVLTEALDYQVKADSINTLATVAKSKVDRLPAEQQKAEKVRIAEMETRSSDYQKLADKRFNESGHDSSLQKSSSIPTSPVGQTPKEALSSFRVETDPAKKAGLRTGFETPFPDGLVYRIQVGVLSKPVDNSYFKGLSPVSGYRIPGTETTKYYAGLFRRLTDANAALLQVRQIGFRDAFLNAVMDGKPVSLERAAILEKEWGQEPLKNINTEKKSSVQEVPTLVYRVEIAKTPKPVNGELNDAYRNLAGDRGLEILGGEGGTFVYLIGKFITFESASEYADLVIRNGYREARVVAYLGSKEIPVGTAKQLFESQK